MVEGTVPMVSGKRHFVGSAFMVSGEKAGRLERGVTVHLVSLLIIDSIYFVRKKNTYLLQ
jgi:hypothetical protein